MARTKKQKTSAPNQRIRKVCEYLGTQAKAAEAAGVSLRLMQKYVAGDESPSYKTLGLLAVRTGFNLEWLLSGRGPERNNDTGGTEAERYWKQLTSSESAMRELVPRALVYGQLKIDSETNEFNESVWAERATGLIGKLNSDLTQLYESFGRALDDSDTKSLVADAYQAVCGDKIAPVPDDWERSAELVLAGHRQALKLLVRQRRKKTR